MMVYIKRTHIITLDYIELSEQYRTDNAIFSTYINLLEIFLRENGYNRTYIVNETSNKYGGEDIDEESRFFKKISFLENFGRIEAKYCIPPIGIFAFAGSSEAFLYIKSKNEEERISKEDYLDIVKSIYYDYYCVWYEDFLQRKEFEHYKMDLDNSFNSIKLPILSKSFKVNYSPDALFISKSKIKTIVPTGTTFLASPFLIGLCQYTLNFHETQNNLITLIGSVEISGGILVSIITTIVNYQTKKKKW